MTDIGNIARKVCYYMRNPDPNLPTASDDEQGAEIEKTRKAISDFGEGKRNILPEYPELATEALCLETARQIMKEQRGN